MASTNFLVFDEGKQNMMSDGDYSANTQRARGVTPGIAYPNLHNKLYYQVSVMAKAIADFMVAQGANASDEDVEQLTADISTAFTNFVDNKTKDVYLPLSGGTMKGNINANGYNITATKFIGNLQGKADSAANAEVATKATQDSKGRQIDTTYLKLSGGQMTGYLSYILSPTNGILYLKNGKADQTTGTSFFISHSGNVGILDFSTGEQRNLLLCTPKGLPNFPNGATAPTPAASDNSTRVATTAFVKSLFTKGDGWEKNNITGLIKQYGEGSTFINNMCTITFPINFITEVKNINITDISARSDSVNNLSVLVDSVSESQFKVIHQGGGDGEDKFYWEAIGY